MKFKSLKESLKSKLTARELEFLPRAFDVVGSIAIIDIPSELVKKEKLIAYELLECPNIKTVVKKIGKIKGRLRLARYKILAGEKTKETIHKENNCLFKLHLEKTYFSPRLSTDRLDIARQVKKNEKVLVMFSGAGPYAICIAKNSRARPKEIYSIELNKDAVIYAYENIILNKISNVNLIQGDVEKVAKKLSRKLKFDRIVMPRPQLEETFLKEAFMLAAPRCYVNYHDFLPEEEIPNRTINLIKESAKKAKKKVNILAWKKFGDIAPYKFRIRVDFLIY